MVVELKVINGRIRKIGNGEKTFREEMATLSVELLEYVPTTGDIDAVNRLMAVLTPKNFEIAKAFFAHFLSHSFKDGKFGKKSTNKELVRKRLALTAELIKANGNIWTWFSDKAKKEKKEPVKKDMALEIEKVVFKAIKGDAEMDAGAALRAAIIGFIKSGVSLGDLMNEFGAAMEVAANDVKQLVADAA